MALDKVLFSKYKSVGIIADDRDSAELIFRDKVKFAYDDLPAWIHDTFQVKTDRKGELVFENNHSSAINRESKRPLIVDVLFQIPRPMGMVRFVTMMKLTSLS